MQAGPFHNRPTSASGLRPIVGWMVDRLTREDFNLSQRSTYDQPTLQSVSSQLGLNLALAPSWKGHFLRLKCAHSPLILRILSSRSAPFTLMTVQVPNLALTHTKRITVYDQHTLQSVSSQLVLNLTCSCTVVGLNGTLVEAKIYELGTLECAFFSFNMCLL